MDLDGPWRAHPADDDLRRAFVEDAFDDAAWAPVPVPGHWRTTPAFADDDGPLLYRTSFAAAAPGGQERAWLVFDGIFAQGDVWLDEAYLGDTEDYVVAHRFEVTDLLRARAEHTLAVEVGCPGPGEPLAKRALTGAFQTGDHLDPRWNPGGIWRPVRLVTTGPVTIRHARLLCQDADEERAILALRAVVDTQAATTVTFRTRVAGVEHEHRQPVAAGENRVNWTVAIPEPALWWPHALGPQVLHDVEVDACLDDGTVSDRRRWRTGLRTVELRRWVLHVNGERLFAKGVNLSPTRADLADATADEIARDLRLAKEAGLDLVRVHTHVSRPELYDAADELGLLVWQDLPLHRRYARQVKAKAVRQAREVVDLLGHHPSVALWCAHNEPYAVDEKLPAADADHGLGRRAKVALWSQQLPTWNRSLLDRSLTRELDKSDGTRPVVAHSGVVAHLPQLDGTDTHLWFGWYGGTVDDLAGHAARLPRQMRFVSELGAQALPDDVGFCRPADWPDLDWERLARDHGVQVSVFDRVVPPLAHATLEDWRDATQAYQAHVVDRAVRVLRRLKYRPTGGFALYRLADVRADAAGFGVLDAQRRPKAAWAALVEACKPVIPVADPLPDHLHPGDELALAVHVVSDLRAELDDVVVEAVVRWRDGEHRVAWQGAIDADSCVKVGDLELTVPDVLGPLTVELTLTAGDHAARAADATRVV